MGWRGPGCVLVLEGVLVPIPIPEGWQEDGAGTHGSAHWGCRKE